MIDFFRDRGQLIVLVLLWVFTTLYVPFAIYALLPLSVVLLWKKELYGEIVMGFLIILILSDMDPFYVPMRQIKTAKSLYMVMMTLFFITERKKFMPYSSIFLIFLPFFVYSVFPMIWSGRPIDGTQKTISYALLYLVVPNYLLLSFRTSGWKVIRDLILFISLALIVGYLLVYFRPHLVLLGGRFRGLFGNPNGLGLFCFLFFVLFSVVNTVKGDLFSFREKVLIYGLIAFIILKCGSRTALVATLMFVAFTQVFKLSTFLGFVSFVAFIVIAELISTNLSYIVISLGLEDLFRLETIEDGSGRYFAWRFAWEKIQDYFVFGGGFGNDEYIMRQHYPYLRSQGHHGGVHNSYLTMWFNVGIVGIVLFFRSFALLFIKANKRVNISFAIMFSVLFAIMYESWINGSLNPFTIMVVLAMTIVTEDEIVAPDHDNDEEEPHAADEKHPLDFPSTAIPARR